MIGLLAVLIVAEAQFYADLGLGGVPAHGRGLRVGLAACVLLIALIGGRIVPAFTRNWLSKHQAQHLPSPPGQPFDIGALTGLTGALLLRPRARG